MKTFIVIAAHNEEKTIGKVIDDLKKHNYSNIIVVDDFSKDRTREIAERKKVAVLHHFLNRGQGAALATGNEYALRNNADIIVHFDGDGQMDVNEIRGMIAPIIEGRADITIGSRFLSKKSKIPFGKMLILLIGRIYLRLFYGVKLTDSQCGFRAMSRKAAQMIEIRQDKMEHASEILIEVFKKRIKYREIPVTIKYTKYSTKHTHHGKFHLWSGIKIAFKIMLKRLMK
ncbi:glycosyltransferase family 2 protein [Candidatus Woesearchaeota archaeon]|nr:glycosyltransferase family 2 protein [Candidatus Woesearchaeota archaeon]